MADDTDDETAGTPSTLVGCTACDNTYPARPTTNGGFRPIGTDGTCKCGSDDFELLDE